MLAIHLGMVAGAAEFSGLEIPHGQHQAQVVLLAPHQGGTEQGGRCSHPHCPLDDIRTLLLGCGQEDLPHRYFVGYSGIMAEPK